MAQGKSIPIGQSDSPQGVLLRVIENPQGKKPGTTSCEAPQERSRIKLSPLQRAHSEMVRELSLLAPSIPVPSSDPSAEEIAEFEPHLVKVAECFDRYVGAIGRELHSHVLGVDLSQFDRPCFTAIDGCALFECAKAVEGVEEGTEIRTSMWVAE